MDQQAAQDVLQIQLRYEREDKIFNIEIEQSLYVQELIEEMRRQLNIPERKNVILKSGSNRLDENRLFSSFGFPNQVMIDIITEDPNQTEQRQQLEKASQIQKQQAQHCLPPQQNQALQITLRYEGDNKIFNIEIEQSIQVQELIEEIRIQLNIPMINNVILKQGQNRLEENRVFSSFGFPNQVMIDIITEDSQQTIQGPQDIDKEIVLLIKVPLEDKKLKVQVQESTKIFDLIDKLKQYVKKCDGIIIIHRNQQLGEKEAYETMKYKMEQN